jgi:uncharacterized phiE125 gp8 family phage protein
MSEKRTLLITAPAIEPVSAVEAKLNLRLDGSDHDTLVGELIGGARQYIEQVSNRALIEQTWDLYLDEFPGESVIELPYPPLISVTGIYYTPDGSSEQTYAASNYLTDVISEPGRIVLKSTASWPGNTLIDANGVRIRFVCGYGKTAADVPKPLRQAIQFLVSQWYDAPNSYEVGPVMETPFTVKALIAPYRIHEF